MKTKTIIRTTAVALALGLGFALGGCDTDERDIDADDRADGTCPDDNWFWLDVAARAAVAAGDAATGGNVSPFADLAYSEGGCGAGDLSGAALDAISSIVNTAVQSETLKNRAAEIDAIAFQLKDYTRAVCQNGTQDCNLHDQWSNDGQTMNANVTTLGESWSYFKNLDSPVVGFKESMAAAGMSLVLQSEELTLRNLQGQSANWAGFKDNACTYESSLRGRYDQYKDMRSAYNQVHEHIDEADQDDDWGVDTKYFFFTRPSGEVIRTEGEVVAHNVHIEREAQLREQLAQEIADFDRLVIGDEASYNDAIGALHDICADFVAPEAKPEAKPEAATCAVVSVSNSAYPDKTTGSYGQTGELNGWPVWTFGDFSIQRAENGVWGLYNAQGIRLDFTGDKEGNPDKTSETPYDVGWKTGSFACAD